MGLTKCERQIKAFLIVPRQGNSMEDLSRSNVLDRLPGVASDQKHRYIHAGDDFLSDRANGESAQSAAAVGSKYEAARSGLAEFLTNHLTS